MKTTVEKAPARAAAYTIQITLLFSVAWIGGCQSPADLPVHTLANKEVSAVCESFCIGATPGKIEGLDLKRSSELRRQVIDSVIGILEEKGLQQRDPDEADLMVHIVYNSMQQVDISNTGYSRSRDRNWDLQFPVNELSLTVNPHEEGSLVIEIRTNPDDTWVWSGWCAGLHNSSQLRNGRIVPILRKLLEAFPPVVQESP